MRLRATREHLLKMKLAKKRIYRLFTVIFDASETIQKTFSKVKKQILSLMIVPKLFNLSNLSKIKINLNALKGRWYDIYYFCGKSGQNWV